MGYGWAEDVAGIERKKTIVKLYDVSSKDNLVVDNQFGNVSISLWNREEIRVDITVTANSNTDARIQQFLDAVDITERRNGDQIVLKTNINKSGSNSTWNMVKNSSGEKNFVQIDYKVSMPKGNALTVKNSFGNTSIPTFYAPLTIGQKHGNFYADVISGNQVDIDVAFGKAEIHEMDNGKLDISYSSLQLDKANNIRLNNKFGKLKIGEITSLDGTIGYSGAQIGTVRQSCNVKLDFSGGFKIEQLTKSVDNIDIQANYSSVVLPVAEINDYNFDVTVSYGGFRYPSDSRFMLTSQPNEDDNSRGPRFTKQYSGKVGKGTGTKVRVTAKFGDVRFQ